MKDTGPRYSYTKHIITLLEVASEVQLYGILLFLHSCSRLKCFKRTDKNADDERSGTPPPDYAFNNEAYEDVSSVFQLTAKDAWEEC